MPLRNGLGSKNHRDTDSLAPPEVPRVPLSRSAPCHSLTEEEAHAFRQQHQHCSWIWNLETQSIQTQKEAPEAQLWTDSSSALSGRIQGQGDPG